MEKQKKLFILSFLCYLCLNPIFVAAISITPSDIKAFTELEMFMVGLYFIIWALFGIVIYLILPMVDFYKNKDQRKNDIKSMDQIIDEAWKEHNKEKKEIKDGKM